MPSPFTTRNVLLAALAVYLLSVGAAAYERRAAGADTDAIVAAAVSMSNVPAERAAAMESLMRPMMANYPIVILIGSVLTWVLLTTIFFLVLKVTEAGLSWGTVFAATIYAALAQTLAGLILLVALSAARKPTVDDLVQRTFLNTNVAAVLPADSAPWLVALGRQLDALSILYLMVFTGVLSASGRSKASDGALATAVGVTFVLWLVIRVGWAFAFGR
jgi:hypothetical protein